MTSVLQLLTTLIVSGAAQNIDFVNKLGRGIGKEVSAIKHPIDETLTYVGSSQCSNVKKLIGVEYNQVIGFNEPDLNQLTLNFISQAFRITYNITAAAQLIPLTRGYNPNQKLIIFIHGFTDDPTTATANNITSAFLSQGEFNILVLDGSSLIRWLYLRSTTYVRFMGEKLGATLAAMVQGGMNPKAIHLIGHSLGSHIAGFTGKTFTDLTGLKVGRISGLDPAGPCFSHIDPEMRLKSSDADFVDVIHTDAGVYGLKDSVGHVDFFPNTGAQQPNCVLQTCSHSRAWLYYAESVVKPEAFLALPCQDWDAFKEKKCGAEPSVMGYSTKATTRGNYYLRTGEDSPYGLGLAGTRYENNEGVIRTVGSKLFG